MTKLSGSSTEEIEAPIEEVWSVVEDVESAPEWQGGLKAMNALERDDEGRATLCESQSDAKVRTISSVVRFSYEPLGRLSWRQEKGELKSLEGHWQLDELDGGRTRATYWLEGELGRMLGMVIRGPLVDALRDMLVGGRARELKRRMEG